MTISAINNTLFTAINAIDGVATSGLTAVDGQTIAAGGGTFALIAHTAQTLNVTTPAIDTTGANLIVIGVGGDVSGAPTDSKSNTWTALTTQTATAISSRLYYCFNPTVGSGHTFTQTVNYNSIFVAAFSGSASSPFDVENGNVNTGAIASIQPAGSITPSVNNELVIYVSNSSNGVSSGYSVDGGFTFSDTLDTVSGANWGGTMGYLIQTSAAAAQPTVSWSVGTARAAIAIASFKAA